MNLNINSLHPPPTTSGSAPTKNDRLMVESAHPRVFGIDYDQHNLAAWTANDARIVVDADETDTVKCSFVIAQAAAAGDGLFRLQDLTTAASLTPNITVPQGTTVIVDRTDLAMPGAASGSCRIRPDSESGQAGTNITTYAGGCFECMMDV